MNRLVWGTVLILRWIPGCEFVAGVQDKVLALDAAPFEAGAVSPVPSGDDAEPPTPEGGPDATTSDAGPGDADAGTQADAAPDAPVDPAFLAPDAGTTDPSAPCEGQGTYLFCDDFDLVTAVGQLWTYTLTTDDGGTLALDTRAYTSPSQSLEVVAPASTGDQLMAAGYDVASSLSTSFRLAFDVRLDVDSVEGLPQQSTLAQVTASRSGAKMELDYQILSTGSAQLQVYAGADGGAPLNVPLPLPPLRTWTRLVIAYDTTNGVEVLQNGVMVGSNPGDAGAPEQTKFLVGMVYQVPPGSELLTLEFDNVVFRGN